MKRYKPTIQPKMFLRLAERTQTHREFIRGNSCVSLKLSNSDIGSRLKIVVCLGRKQLQICDENMTCTK